LDADGFKQGRPEAEDAMSIQAPDVAVPPAEVEYPDCDGQPMSDNTLQFRWIVTIQGGIDDLYRDDPNVFVAGDLLWYPVEGDNKTRLAPDTMVAFGRPKGYRGSYMQWREGGIAPQVVFEVLSPNNTPDEMDRKRAWYFNYGVEEYYEFEPDPDHLELKGWIREGDVIREVAPISGWTSPRLGVRFEVGEDLTIVRPDGREFTTYVGLSRRLDESDARAESERRRADELVAQAERDRQRADELVAQAERDRQRAEELAAQAERDRQRAEESVARAERYAARLRELGLEPEE
jgi:Uma2 family endonuclease